LRTVRGSLILRVPFVFDNQILKKCIKFISYINKLLSVRRRTEFVETSSVTYLLSRKITGYIFPRHIRRPKNINNNYSKSPGSRTLGFPGFPSTLKATLSLVTSKTTKINSGYARRNQLISLTQPRTGSCRRAESYLAQTALHPLPVIFLSRVLLYAVGYLHSRQIYSTGLSRYPTLWQFSAISPD
jgi:hypothetical protein